MIGRLRQAAHNRRIRIVAAVLVISLTLGLFAYYLTTRPDTLSTVLSLDAGQLLLLTLAYVGTVAANGFVLWASLRLLKKPVRFIENVALTGSSSVVNFFGPLQSGPGFRAVYLKQRHGVSLKGFFGATLLFYGFFAAVNAAVIAVAAVMAPPASEIPPLVLVAIVAISLVVALLALRIPRLSAALRTVKLANVNTWYIFLGAAALSAATAAAYFVELTHVDPSITIGQAVVYAAAANLALFVSLTPGAIGFRESFLLLSQQLHGIAPDTVIAASIIDRAFYVVFLLVMFALLLLVGARSRLRRND